MEITELKQANKIASEQTLKHFNQEGIGILCTIGLNVNNDNHGAFTILTAGMETNKIKQMLEDLLDEFDNLDEKYWVKSL